MMGLISPEPFLGVTVREFLYISGQPVQNPLDFAVTYSTNVLMRIMWYDRFVVCFVDIKRYARFMVIIYQANDLIRKRSMNHLAS